MSRLELERIVDADFDMEWVLNLTGSVESVVEKFPKKGLSAELIVTPATDVTAGQKVHVKTLCRAGRLSSPMHAVISHVKQVCFLTFDLCMFFPVFVCFFWAWRQVRTCGGKVTNVPFGGGAVTRVRIAGPSEDTPSLRMSGTLSAPALLVTTLSTCFQKAVSNRLVVKCFSLQ